jgi:hypothetical protein
MGRVGGGAKFEVNRDGTVKAVNRAGAALTTNVEVTRKGNGFEFILDVPYSNVKGQNCWLNVVEGGEYELRFGGKVTVIGFASTDERVRLWLEFELAGGLRTWEAIFAEKGYVPTGLGAGADWDKLSDSGGYAHLIAACAQWLIYLDGKHDWELMKVPAVR